MTRSRLNFLSELPLSLPCSARIERQRKARLSIVLQRALDRVNVLGENGQEGHTGFVELLSNCGVLSFEIRDALDVSMR